MKSIVERYKLKKVAAAVLIIVMILTLADGRVTIKAADRYPYLIKVNKQMNTVTIYKKDSSGKYTIPHKAMVCSVGWATPVGTFKTPAKYRWKALIEEVWGQYATRITGAILFHSVWYYNPDPSQLSAVQYNKLGTTCSHGCIRLTVEDAKWIYDNCSVGTTVTIYNSSNAGPLGKPQAIKLPTNATWDPTDVTNKNNPYNNKKPVIKGAVNQKVAYGSTVNLKKGVTAIGTTGFDITSSIKISGVVDTQKPGKYKITYSVTDLLMRTAKTSITYTVLEDKSSPVITGVKDQVVNGSTVIDKDFARKGVKASLNKEPISSKNIKVTINKKSEELYMIQYKVTGKNGRYAEAAAKVEVDNQAPVFKGIKDKTITPEQVVDKTFALKGVTISDNKTKMSVKDIKVNIEKNEDGSYIITYTAEDALGNIAAETASCRLAHELRIEGAVDRFYNTQGELTEAYVRAGVTAYNKDVDITDEIIVEIGKQKDGIYPVTYRVEDDLGNEVQTTVRFMPNPQVQSMD